MEKQLKEIIRSVIREEFISELSKNDIHVKEIMKFYDKGTYSTKKAVSIFVSGKTNATRNQILDDLGDMGYDDVWEVMDHFKLKIESVNESSDINSLKKIHDAIFKFLRTKKGVGEVKEFSEFPNRYGDDVSTFSVKYNIEDKYNYDLQEIKIEYSTSRVFIPNKGYFPFRTFNDIKNIINTKSSLKESVNESDLKGYLVADVVDDIIKSIGSKFVSGQIKDAPNRNYIYLKLTDIKFGSGVVKMLKSQFGIDAKIDKTFGNIPSVSFASKKVVSESVNEEKVYIDYLNKAKGFKQDRIKFNSYEDAVKWAKKNFEKFSPDMIKYESVNERDVVPGGLAKGLSLNDIAEKHGVSVDIMVAQFKKGIAVEMEHTTDREVAKEITLDHLFEDPKYYDKLAKVEEYVDKKGVERVAAALPQTEEEPIKECKTCNSK